MKILLCAVLLAAAAPVRGATVTSFFLTAGGFGSSPCDPPPAANSFKTTATSIYAFLEIAKTKEEEPAVTVDWYDPAGQLVISIPFPFFPLPVPIEIICYRPALIAPNFNSRQRLTPGTWSARASVSGAASAIATFEITLGEPVVQSVAPSTNAGSALAAGSIMTIKGRGFCGPGLRREAAGSPWPADLGGASVQVDGVEAPLQFAGEIPGGCQINAQVPWNAAGEPRTLRVRYREGATTVLSDPVTFQSAAISPSFFSAPPDYPSLLQIANRGYSLMSESNRVFPGETLVGYADGMGQTNPPRATGQAAELAAGEFARVAAPVEAWLRSCAGDECVETVVEVLYAIAYPASPAAYQLAFTLPEIAVEASREYRLLVRVGGRDAPEMKLHLAARP